MQLSNGSRGTHGFGTNFTDAILSGVDDTSMREIKRVVRKADKVRLLLRCSERAPLIAEVVRRGGSWLRLHMGRSLTSGD